MKYVGNFYYTYPHCNKFITCSNKNYIGGNATVIACGSDIVTPLVGI